MSFLKVEEVTQYEKIESLNKMEDDLNEINSIYHDLNKITTNQGESIDIQFEFVEETKQNVGFGYEDIKKTDEYISKRKFSYISIVIIVFLIFLLIFIALLFIFLK
jgi:t-SNARE complex subunit (syntaxin)